jgi:hypothetical protein
MVDLGDIDGLVRSGVVHHALVVCAWMHARLWGVEKV